MSEPTNDPKNWTNAEYSRVVEQIITETEPTRVDTTPMTSFFAEVNLTIKIAAATQEEASKRARELRDTLASIGGNARLPVEEVAQDVYIVLEDRDVVAVRPTLDKAKESVLALLPGYCGEDSDDTKRIVERVAEIDEDTVMADHGYVNFPDGYDVKITKRQIIL